MRRRSKHRQLHEADLVTPYVDDLANVIDMEAIRAAGVTIGVDPLGGAALPYWQKIGERYRLDLTIVNDKIDPTFRFMTLDHDGKIRMDCSSPYAMAGLVSLKDRFQVAVGNDADADRHGIVTPSRGLMNPNHYLAVAIHYLLTHRPQLEERRRGWQNSGKQLAHRPGGAEARSKTFRSSRRLQMVLARDCSTAISASAAKRARARAFSVATEPSGRRTRTASSSLCWPRRSLRPTGRDPGAWYDELTKQLGRPFYARMDLPATGAQKKALKSLRPEQLAADELAGEPITAKLTRAPGNNAEIGGLKVSATQRLVCRTALGNRRSVQGLRGKPSL